MGAYCALGGGGEIQEVQEGVLDWAGGCLPSGEGFRGMPVGTRLSTARRAPMDQPPPAMPVFVHVSAGNKGCDGLAGRWMHTLPCDSRIWWPLRH